MKYWIDDWWMSLSLLDKAKIYVEKNKLKIKG